MTESISLQHAERIKTPEGLEMYRKICAECEQREGGMTETDQMLVLDLALTEDIKQLLLEDIHDRGLGSVHNNGRQSYYKENASIPRLRAMMDQQRKILAELRLTPASRKAVQISMFKDDFDEFD